MADEARNHEAEVEAVERVLSQSWDYVYPADRRRDAEAILDALEAVRIPRRGADV